jgi:hypothetical protein
MDSGAKKSSPLSKFQQMDSQLDLIKQQQRCAPQKQFCSGNSNYLDSDQQVIVQCYHVM